MHDRNKREAAVETAAGGEAGGVSPKERIFSIIRKALEEGIAATVFAQYVSLRCRDV
ncbi:hypothetical protein [Thermofilum sp.]|uniref:hypothetical protein n=1 Tax=Thermofilum sp. TaxID=1961369 RepID=UPI003170F039